MEKNNLYSVYIHTCPNGKKYVGTTRIKPEYRWNHGKGYKKQTKFYEDIQKYGWDNIKHEIIFEGLTRNEAEQKEREVIAKYRSNEEEFGYNITSGGFHNYGEDNPFYQKKHSEEAKKVMKEKWDYNKHFKPETIEKMKEAMHGEKNPMYGRKHTEKSNEKNMFSQKERKEVEQYTIEGKIIAKYPSIRSAARAVNGDKSHISRACKNDKIIYGFKWKFAQGGV